MLGAAFVERLTFLRGYESGIMLALAGNTVILGARILAGRHMTTRPAEEDS